jgi:small-conductance mechanosensitive channel
MQIISFIARNIFSRRLLFICLVIFSGMHSEVLAQDSPGQYQKSELLTSESVPVIVDGRELFLLGGVSSYPAKERAKVVAERIKKLAEDPKVDPKSLQIVKEGDITYIKAGELIALGLVENDAVREGISMEIMTGVTRDKIAQAIRGYRNDRAPRTLLINSGYALIASVLTALLLWGILRLFTWLNVLAQKRIKARIEGLESKSHYIIDADQIWDVMRGFLKTMKVVAMLVVIYFYLNLVLGLYPWTRLFAQYLFTITLNPLRIIGLGLVNALPNIFFLVIFIFIIRYILKVTRLFFSGIERGRIHVKNFEREWGLPTYKIVRLLIVSFAVIVAYPYIPGSSSDAFKGVSIFLGVIFSLGSSSVLSNIIAGYTITYRRAFKVGDRIMINDLTGDVVDRSVLVTRLRSFKNEEIVIPNSIVLNSNIINYSTEARAKGLILHTNVGIGYEVPWRQVEAMLLLAADRTKGIKSEPKPFVLQQSLGDFAVNYELNVYIDDARQMMQLYTDLHRNVLDVFNENSVQIMTPNYEHDPEQPKIVPKDQWYTPPAKKTPDNA